MSAITEAFVRAAAEGRTALIPYLTVGWPNPSQSVDLIEAVCNSGADIVELGVPFSDPIADGRVIREAGWAALREGTTVRTCLHVVRTLRSRGVTIPIVLMGYLNPFLQIGVEHFSLEAKFAGADGVIVPDVTLDTFGDWVASLSDAGLDCISFVAPTTTPERIPLVTGAGSGFVYCISRLGITGAREHLSPELPALLQRVRQGTTLPVAVGFGVSRPQHVAQLVGLADGVIVGSALIERIAAAPVPEQTAAAERFIKGMRAATTPRTREGKCFHP